MEQMITANIALDIFSIVLSLIPVVYLLSCQRYRQPMNRHFLGICVSNIFMILGDIPDWLFQEAPSAPEKAILNGSSILFYTASAFVLYFFARYIYDYLEISGRARKLLLTAIRVLWSIQVFFAAISPFTGAFFYVTDDGYQRGRLFIISQLVPLSCYLLFSALVIVYRRRLTRREAVFFLLYIFVPLGGGAAQMFLRGIAVVNIGVSLALLFILVNIQFEYEIDLQRKEQELAERHIDIMLSQIQPHFLYNALGTIAYLCRHDPLKAEKATEEFARFLRGNMDSLKKRDPVPFEKELNHVRNYLYLEQQRFQERLRVEYDIGTKDFYIPPLSLQPLVENAVRHGILHRKEGGTVTIRTVEDGEDAVVTIADDGIGMEKARDAPNLGTHTGIAIENVRSRLRIMVGGSMEIQSSDEGTVITLRIPLMGGI